MPAHFAGRRRDQGFVAHLIHAQPPLFADQRLDDGVASVAMPDLVAVGLLLDQQALGFQLVDDALACLERGHAVVWQSRHVHAAVLVHAVEDLQPVALPDLVIHRVMAWRHLERARAEVFLHRIVGDDRQLAPDERQQRGLTHQVPVSLVLWVDGDARVSEHRLGPDGGDAHLPAAFHRVAHVIEGVLMLLPLDLEV